MVPKVPRCFAMCSSPLNLGHLKVPYFGVSFLHLNLCVPIPLVGPQTIFKFNWVAYFYFWPSLHLRCWCRDRSQAGFDRGTVCEIGKLKHPKALKCQYSRVSALGFGKTVLESLAHSSSSGECWRPIGRQLGGDHKTDEPVPPSPVVCRKSGQFLPQTPKRVRIF